MELHHGTVQSTRTCTSLERPARTSKGDRHVGPGKPSVITSLHSLQTPGFSTTSQAVLFLLSFTQTTRQRTFAKHVLAKVFTFCLKGSKSYRSRTLPPTTSLMAFAYRRGNLQLLREEYDSSLQVVENHFSRSRNFQFVVEDGVITAVGRRIPLTDSMKNHKYLDYRTGHWKGPVLSSKSALAKSIMEDHHDVWHVKSPQYHAAMMLHNFLVDHPTSLSLRISKDCYKCRRLRAKPLRVESGPLPEYRASGSPNRVLSVDIIGPYEAQEKRGQNTRSGNSKTVLHKLYFLISACSFTRKTTSTAMDSLSSQSLISAFNTLFMNQGSPELILADAGSQLSSVSRQGLEADQDEEEDEQISDEVLKDVSKDLAARQGVEMRTHTPLASWRSGACESLIGCLKSILKETRVRQRDKMSAVALINLMSRATSILNSRPITLLASSAADVRESRFLTPHSMEPMNTTVPARDLNEATIYTERAKAGERSLAIFRDLHRTHYLKSLKILGGRKPNQDPRLRVDDVVVIPDKISSTGLPALGIVTEVFELDASIRYNSKNGKRLKIKRPQEKLLYLLSPHATKETNLDPYSLLSDDLLSRSHTATGRVSTSGPSGFTPQDKSPGNTHMHRRGPNSSSPAGLLMSVKASNTGKAGHSSHLPVPGVGGHLPRHLHPSQDTPWRSPAYPPPPLPPHAPAWTCTAYPPPPSPVQGSRWTSRSYPPPPPPPLFPRVPGPLAPAAARHTPTDVLMRGHRPGTTLPHPPLHSQVLQ